MNKIKEKYKIKNKLINKYIIDNKKWKNLY